MLGPDWAFPRELVNKIEWNDPETEAGLQSVLAKLAACREADDRVETARGLLRLAYLVKWVRSDTDDPPFVRSHQLTLEALDLFRHVGDEAGQVRALVAASALAEPVERKALLDEAMALAERLGDQDLIASAISGQARALAPSDRLAAAQLHQRALQLYRDSRNRLGQAHSLFSLAIGDGDAATKLERALESAHLYREEGRFEAAARSLTISLMNAEEIRPLGELEDLAQEGVRMAEQAESQSQRYHFTYKLAQVFSAKGDGEGAAAYYQLANELAPQDVSPLESWQSEVDLIESMVELADHLGHEDVRKLFQSKLDELMKGRPD